jgi:hypothetical protein
MRGVRVPHEQPRPGPPRRGFSFRCRMNHNDFAAGFLCGIAFGFVLMSLSREW